MNSTKFILLLVVSLLLIQSSLGKYQKGSIPKTEKNWQFLGKFVFQTGVANLVNYTVVTSNTNARALLYFWDSATRNLTGANFYSDYEKYLNGELDCEGMVEKAIKGGNHLIESGVTKRFRPSSSIRPYWWFVAVADCTQESINLESYELSWVQVNASHWEYQFSWDEWGVGPAYLISLIFYAIIFAIHVFGCYQLYRIEAYHSLIRLYTLAVLLQLISSFCHYIHYSSYAIDGIGAPGLLAIGNLISWAAQLGLMFLCILIAKGWAITSSYLTQKYLLLAVTGIFILAFLTLFIWSEFLLNPLYALFMYDTPPGIIILIIRFGTVFWFLWCVRDTLRVETNPEKRNFYIPFAIAYGSWFISLPLCVFILSFLPSWVRFKIVTITIMFCDALGLSVLAYLFWPSRARNYFSIRSGGLLESNNAKANTGIKDEDL